MLSMMKSRSAFVLFLNQKYVKYNDKKPPELLGSESKNQTISFKWRKIGPIQAKADRHDQRIQ
jgi:hypothetical protein